MDFEASQDQQAILDAVEHLLAVHAGPARAIAIDAASEYDWALEAALDEAGFLDVALGAETGLLEAALVVEAAARHAGVAAVGAAVLVAPGLTGRRLPGPLALASSADASHVRFAGHARTLLVEDGDEARRLELRDADRSPAPSNFMLPLARLELDLRSDVARGESLGAGSGERLRALWRTALAAECAGLMSAALDTTVDYVSGRRQFGRAIGSFQALQHRLAQCKVFVEGTRWLALDAAASDADPEKAAGAAGYAASAAQHVFTETHQITGAMGFTREHDLHVWSMRLQALALELGGAAAHHRALASARWGE